MSELRSADAPRAATIGTYRTDIAIAAVWFVAALVTIWIGSGRLDQRLLTRSSGDVWFEADIARVMANMSDRFSNHARADVHPLFAMFVLPPVLALHKGLGLDLWVSIRIFLAVVGGLWSSGLYCVFRLTGCRRPDASVFSLVAMTSAGALFWFVIPETHTIGSLSVVLAMLVVGVAMHRPVPEFLEIAVSSSTLGLTVTNWIAGLTTAVVTRPWRRAIQLSVNAFALTVILWTLQKKFVPSAGFFLGNPSESEHIMAPEALGPVRVAIAYFMHAVVMPAIAVVDRPGAADWPIMIVQPSAIGSAGTLGLISSVLWGGLLLIGTWALVGAREALRMRLFVALFILGQFALYQLFGSETFLYVPNFLPALIVLSALGALTPLRPIVLGMAAVLAVTNGINNYTQREHAFRFFSDSEAYHHDGRTQPAGQPPELVPDRTSFSEMRVPGVRVFDEAMASTGGSFTPGLDQFTVSVWVRDANGALRWNSDVNAPPATGIKEKSASASASYPSVVTPYYSVSWIPAGARRYRMELIVADSADVELAVRSSGARPYASIRKLRWADNRLTIGDRWQFEPDTLPAGASISVALLDENTPGWATAQSSVRDLWVKNGWGAARLTLSASGRYTAVIRDLSPDTSVDRPLWTIPGTAPNATGTATAPGTR